MAQNVAMFERKWPDPNDRTGKPRWRWARTVIGGDVCPDDWCLFDGEGKQAARIRREDGGPNDNRWRWTVQVGPDGKPRHGGARFADTGKEAREACEALVPRAREALGRV